MIGIESKSIQIIEFKFIQVIPIVCHFLFFIFKFSVDKGYLVIGFGIGIVLVLGLTLAICVKLYCCQDKRKFRSSKETKCVRHQQCMTSPLDSPPGFSQ